MAKVLTYLREGDTAIFQNGEDIVHRAEQIGILSIDKGWSRSSPYEAEIIFYTTGNSRVHAKGTDTDFFMSINKAIEEAVRLGAR